MKIRELTQPEVIRVLTNIISAMGKLVAMDPGVLVSMGNIHGLDSVGNQIRLDECFAELYMELIVEPTIAESVPTNTQSEPRLKKEELN